MKSQKDFYMEDVQTISLESFKIIEDRLKEYGIILTPEQEDEIYVPLRDAIEKYSNGDYRGYN